MKYKKKKSDFFFSIESNTYFHFERQIDLMPFHKNVFLVDCINNFSLNNFPIKSVKKKKRMRNISHFKDAQCAFRFLLITRYFNWNVFCDSHLKIYKTIEQLSIFGKFLLFLLHHWSLIGIKSGGNTTKRKKRTLNH